MSTDNRNDDSWPLTFTDRATIIAGGVIFVLTGCALGFIFGFFMLGPLLD